MGKSKGLNLAETIIDFHTHSNRSDGSDEREMVVERAIAQANGKKVIMAITDHNIIFDDMEELQQKYGNKVVLVPGIEVSAAYTVPDTGRELEVHIIVLGYDIHNSEFENVMNNNRPNNKVYIEAMLAKLEAVGKHVFNNYEEAKEYALPSPHVGRMILARRMLELGLVKCIDEAFDLYFGSYGKRTCYVDNPHKYMSVSEAVNAAKRAGGVAILAHPYYYQLDESELLELVAHFKECGGEGIESEYGKYGNEERASLKAIVRKFDLLESCGSDYHGNAGEHFQTNCTEAVLRLAERVM